MFCWPQSLVHLVHAVILTEPTGTQTRGPNKVNGGASTYSCSNYPLPIRVCRDPPEVPAILENRFEPNYLTNVTCKTSNSRPKQPGCANRIPVHNTIAAATSYTPLSAKLDLQPCNKLYGQHSEKRPGKKHNARMYTVRYTCLQHCATSSFCPVSLATDKCAPCWMHECSCKLTRQSHCHKTLFGTIARAMQDSDARCFQVYRSANSWRGTRSRSDTHARHEHACQTIASMPL